MPYEPKMGLRVLVLFCTFHLMSLCKHENGAVQSADFCAKQSKKFSPVIACFAQPGCSFFYSCLLCLLSDSQGCLLFSAVYFSLHCQILL